MKMTYKQLVRFLEDVDDTWEFDISWTKKEVRSEIANGIPDEYPYMNYRSLPVSVRQLRRSLDE